LFDTNYLLQACNVRDKPCVLGLQFVHLIADKSNLLFKNSDTFSRLVLVADERFILVGEDLALLSKLYLDLCQGLLKVGSGL
jgi:hypothetical protein